MSDESINDIVSRLSCSLQFAIEQRKTCEIRNRVLASSTEADSRPVVYTEELIAEAKDALVSVEAFLAPAPKNTVRGWLIDLGESVHSTYNQDEARKVVKQLVSDLTFPEFCFTQEIRRQAAIEFKWFPKFHELNAFFEEVCSDERALYEAMNAIAGMPPTDENGLPIEISRLNKIWKTFNTTIKTHAVECSMLSQLQLLEEPDSQVKVKAPSRFLYEQCVEIEDLSKLIRNHFEDKSIVISYGRRQESFDPI